MGRLLTDLTANLPKMIAARAMVEPGKHVTGKALAESIGTTWRVLKERVIRDDKFPLIARGKEGAEWTFDHAAALDHLIARNMTIKENRIRRAADTERLAGFAPSPNAGEPSPYGEEVYTPGDAADRAAEARALKAMADAQMVTHRLKVQQGEYVPAEHHRRVLSEIMTTMQIEMMSMAARLDQAGKWPVELRESVETYQRNALLHLQRAVETALR